MRKRRKNNVIYSGRSRQATSVVRKKYGMGGNSNNNKKCMKHQMPDGTIMDGPVHGPNQVCIEWSSDKMYNRGGILTNCSGIISRTDCLHNTKCRWDYNNDVCL